DCLLLGTRVVIPKQAEALVMKELHDNHDGIVRTKSFARTKVWWPTIEMDIEKTITNCEECQESRNMLPPKPGTWPITAKAWQRLHMDFMYFNGVPIFVLNDVHTKWIEAVPMNKTDSSAVRKSFDVHTYLVLTDYL